MPTKVQGLFNQPPTKKRHEMSAVWSSPQDTVTVVVVPLAGVVVGPTIGIDVLPHQV